MDIWKHKAILNLVVRSKLDLMDIHAVSLIQKQLQVQTKPITLLSTIQDYLATL